MTNSTTTFPYCLLHARNLLASALMVVLLGFGSPRAGAQSDNFNDGNDTGWQRYSLPAQPYGAASYSFPPDGNGGMAYHILAPAIPADPYGLGNARAGAFWPAPTYTARFQVGSDLLSWSVGGRPNFGLMWYLHDVGLGTSDGYVATYAPSNRNLYISVAADESQQSYFCRLQDGDIPLEPGDRVRLVASSHDGVVFVFSIYNLLEPNTPWASVIGSDLTWSGFGGFCGYLIMNEDHPSNDGVSATFDNYAAVAPTGGEMPAMVTDVYPPPAGKASLNYAFVTNSVTILSRDTTVEHNSILLCLDGTWIPNASLTIDYEALKPHNPAATLKAFPGATVSYGIPNLLPFGSKHTNIVVFSDSVRWHTNTWTWTANYRYLFASNSLPVGSLTVRGFDVRMAQTTNGGVNLANSLERARQQLDGLIPVDQRGTGIVQVLNWNKTLAYPDNVPGLCPGTQEAPINIAVGSWAYLELTAGLHRFHIVTDDRAGLYSGVNFADGAVVWEAPGATENAYFEFVVETDGLYPLRCLWEETGGAANLALYSVNLADSTEVLVNDAANPAGVVKAWYPVVCKSASSITGNFTLATGAVNVLNQVDVYGTGDCSASVIGKKVIGGTLTVPALGAAQYYRLDAPRATRITGVTKTATTFVISYSMP